MEHLNTPDLLPLAGSLDDILFVLLGVFTFFKMLAKPFVAAVSYSIRSAYTSFRWLVTMPGQIVKTRRQAAAAKLAQKIKVERDAKMAAAKEEAETAEYHRHLLRKFGPELSRFKPYISVSPSKGVVRVGVHSPMVSMNGSGNVVTPDSIEVSTDNPKEAVDKIAKAIRDHKLAIAVSLEGISKV